MNQNDEKILSLKKLIEERKKELGEKRKFAPITSCSIELDGQRYNLNTLARGGLNLILVKLRSYEMAAEDLDLPDMIYISGFTTRDWIADIQAKLEILSRKAKEAQLKELEDKLNTMLSEDKRTELELDSIAALLK